MPDRGKRRNALALFRPALGIFIEKAASEIFTSIRDVYG
jgi:hypothetical protein